MWKHFQPGQGAFSVIVKGSLQALLFVCLDLRFSALSHFRRVSSLVLRQDCQELCRRVPWLQQQISGESFNTNFEEDKLLIIPYPQTETDITQSATPGSILNFIHNFTICLCVQNKGEKDTFTLLIVFEEDFLDWMKSGDELSFCFYPKWDFWAETERQKKSFLLCDIWTALAIIILTVVKATKLAQFVSSVWTFKAGLKVI